MPPGPPPAPPPFDTSSPGGRKYPATWTSADTSGNPTLWLFGGYGLTFTSSFTPSAPELNDLWEYVGKQNYFGSFQNYWNNEQPALICRHTGPPVGGNLCPQGY